LFDGRAEARFHGNPEAGVGGDATGGPRYAGIGEGAGYVAAVEGVESGLVEAGGSHQTTKRRVS